MTDMTAYFSRDLENSFLDLLNPKQKKLLERGIVNHKEAMMESLCPMSGEDLDKEADRGLTLLHLFLTT